MRKEPIIAVMFAAGLLISCASTKSTIKEVEPPTPAQTQAPFIYTIQPGDQLDIKFFYNPELNETLVVRPDGKISLQLIDEIHAGGLTPPALDDQLTDRFSKELRKPAVTVIVRSFTRQRVFVGGEVNQPGLIVLPAGMTALQAVFQSGGFRETADPSKTLVFRKGDNNQPLPLQINLAAIMNAGGGPDFQLQPDDIVFVPKSAIANANKFITEYVQGLLMFRGWSFGISYRINESNN